MGIIIGFLFFFIGYIIATLGTAQIFSILRVAIPITLAFKKERPDKKIGHLYLMYSFTILLWIGIMTGITFLVYAHTKQFGYYITGFIISALFTIPNTGRTPENENEFIRAYAHYFR